MRVAGVYSFNGGQEAVGSRYPTELEEIKQVIAAVDAATYKTKVSKEKTMRGKVLYDPTSLNKAFARGLKGFGVWCKHRERCEYPTQYYVPGYISEPTRRRNAPFREMDFVKNGLGLEVQFGKYSFMVYNVCAKMTIFHNLHVIDLGVELVPIRTFADEMSTGVSYFEQFVWDLEHRGVADIDIPVLVLGVSA